MPVMRDNALIEAARLGDLDRLKAAHASGLSVKIRGVNGLSALHVAANGGDPGRRPAFDNGRVKLINALATAIRRSAML